jgi:hypothetical protein
VETMIGACLGKVMGVLMWLQPWYQDVDETHAQRWALMRPVAVAICSVTESPKEWAFLLTQGEFECRFARYVLEDRCSDGPPKARCDDGHATGPWQVHRYARTRDAWDKSLPPTLRYMSGARFALHAWRRGSWQSWAYGFQLQKSLAPVQDWAKRRASVMATVLARLKADND